MEKLKKNFFIFFSIFLSALIWLIFIPIWHTPDEQSHFAQVSYLANHDFNNPGGGIKDTTEEIAVSERLLGIERDKVGNNRFTFHPEYKIEYTNSLYGKYEKYISSLVKTDSATKLVKSEATYYPKLYYVPAALIYQIFSQFDLFTKIYLVRFWSLLLFCVNFIFIYKIGKLIFSNNRFMAISLTMLAGFQPMFIFSNIGVTNDSLGNLLFTVFLYCCLKIIINGFTYKNLFFLLSSSYLAIITKVQFIIILPTIALLLTFIFFRDFNGKSRWRMIILSTGVIILALINPYKYLYLSSIDVATESLKQVNFSSLIKFTNEYTFPHTVNEVMPWYWGVYKWLGVTYPRLVHRIINRIFFLALFGFVIWCINKFLKKQIFDRQLQSIILLIFSFCIYFFSIAIFDWLSWYRSGFQLGVQGRYFFPFISVVSLITLIGWSHIFPKKWNLQSWSIKILVLLMATLNIYAIIFVISTYYDISSFQKFIIQASQYKPWFLKGYYLIALITLYLLSLLLLIRDLFIDSRDRTIVVKK